MALKRNRGLQLVFLPIVERSQRKHGQILPDITLNGYTGRSPYRYQVLFLSAATRAF